MKRLRIAATLLLSVASLSPIMAQVEQPIVVNEYNGKQKKTPLEGVGVTVQNAGAAITGQDGTTVLKFRTFHAGDRVTIRRIDKSGYEIFNQQAVEQWNISPQRPFMLVLAKSDHMRQLRDQYNRVASESYERQYKKEQAQLAAERKKTAMLEEEYQRRLTDLENQYQQQLEDLDNYVDQFARIDLSELSGKQSKLIKLVQEGKIDEAIAKYESEDFQAQYEQQSRDIQRIDEAQAQLAKVEAKKRSERERIHAAIGRQIATYRLAGGRENFQKVTNLLKGVADADTTQMTAVYEYAVHALNQRLLDDAERYLQIYIRGTKSMPAAHIDGMLQLGQCYLLQRKFEDTENIYNQAMKSATDIAQAEPERYNPLLVSTALRTVNFYNWVGNFARVGEILSTVSPIADKLYASDPETYAGLASSAYGQEAVALAANGDFPKAIAQGKKAAELGRKVYQADNNNTNYLLWALTQLGQVSYMASEWQGLAESQQEYVDVLETLYKQNPEANAPDLQSGYNNLAEAYIHVPDYTKCEEYLKKSEALLDQLIVTQPDLYRYSQFNLYDIGAHLYHELGNSELKLRYIDKAADAFGRMPVEEQNSCRELYDALVKMKE